MSTIYSSESERIYITLLDSNREPVSGEATNINLKIWRESDNHFYDFDDDTFKDAGWTQIEGQPFSELNATHLPGIYAYEFNPQGEADTYGLWIDYKEGLTIARGMDTVIAGGIYDDFKAHENAQSAFREWFSPSEGALKDVTITISDDVSESPISGARIEIWSEDGSGCYLIGHSSANGTIQSGLSPGTYSVKISAFSRYTFTFPETLEVPSDVESVEETYYGSAFSPAEPSGPETCVVFGWIVDAKGRASQGLAVSATIASRGEFTSEGIGIEYQSVLASTGAQGYFELELIKNERYNLSIEAQGYSQAIDVPASSNANYKDL